MTSYQVGVAAEAFAASLFAQAGCDVLVQYGANQPEYDLVVAHKDNFLKISVKGSQDGGWGLNQKYKKEGVSYHEAINLWGNGHSSQIVYCLVQFKDVKFGESPRVYLATIKEIADALKKARNGYGETILWEHHFYTRGVGAKTTDEIPICWRFNKERVENLLRNRLA